MENRKTFLPKGRQEGKRSFQKKGLKEAVKEGRRVIFVDWMRYGLISNLWRS